MPSLDSLNCRRSLEVAGKTYHYYSLPDAAAQLGDISRLPTSLKVLLENCLLYTSPSPRDKRQSRMPSSA